MLGLAACLHAVFPQAPLQLICKQRVVELADAVVPGTAVPDEQRVPGVAERREPVHDGRDVDHAGRGAALEGALQAPREGVGSQVVDLSTKAIDSSTQFIRRSAQHETKRCSLAAGTVWCCKHLSRLSFQDKITLEHGRNRLLDMKPHVHS